MTKPFYARYYLAIMLAVVFLLPFISRGTRLAIQGNNNDVKDWLPSSYPESADLKWFQHHFAGEQFALVSWQGCTLGDDEKLKLLSAKLLSPPPSTQGSDRSRLFSEVITGPGMLDEMTGPPLDLSYREAIRRLEGVVVGPRVEGEGDESRATCLVVTLSEEGKKDNRNKRRALAEIENAAAECAIPVHQLRMGGPPVDNVAIDIEGERTLYRLAGLSGIVGLGLSYWCFRCFRLTFIVFAVGVLSAGISLAMVYYFGLLERWVTGMATARFGTVDAILMSMPAVVYVLGLSGAIHIVNYYRDACREGGAHGAAEMAIRHGWVPCTLAAVTTAVGLGSLFTSDITPICKFGTFSAVGVIGTLSLLFFFLPASLFRFASKPEPSDDGGPADRFANEGGMHPLMRRFASFVIRRNRWVCAGWGIIMIFFAVGLTQIDTSVQLLKLFDADADIIDDYRWLEANLGNLVPMEVVFQIDPAACRGGGEDAESNGKFYRMTLLERMELIQRVQRRIEAMDEVGRAISVATFAPSISRSSTNLLNVAQRFAINRQLEAHYEDQLLASDFLEEENMPADSSQPGPHGPRQLWRISSRVAALMDVDYGVFVGDIRGEVEPVLAGYRRRDQVLRALKANEKALRFSKICLLYDQGEDGSSARAAQLLRELLRESGAHVEHLNVDQLPTDEEGNPVLSERLKEALGRHHCLINAVTHRDIDLAMLVPETPLVVDVKNSALEEDELLQLVKPKYTGVVPLVYKTQRQLLLSLRESIGWAFALIAIIMMCVLRSPSAGLISMIPNIFPIVLVFGALGWLGIKVDIGIMMTASVALGVAVDDTVHFLFWFQRGMRAGLNRQVATMMAYERCSRALFQTTVIGGLGLAVFAFSTFTPTQQFGYLMVTLLAAALVGDLFLLPAILAGPVGRFFCNRLKPEATEVQHPEMVSPHLQGSHKRLREDSGHRSVRA